MKISFFKLVLVLVCAFLLACAPSDTPEMAVKEWLQGIVDQDGLKVEDRTCSALQAELQKSGTMMTALGMLGQGLLGGEKPKYDISGVKVNLRKTEGDVAEVNITGKMRVAIGLAVQSQNLNETLKVVREDGKWKVCESLNSALRAPTKFANQAPTLVPKTVRSELHDLGLIVASAYDPANDQNQLFTMRPDGTDLTQITFEGINIEPQWSPDGQKIWFVSARDGRKQIYTMNSDGSNQMNFSDTVEESDRLQFSPDGERVLYKVGEDIWVAKIDGNNKKKIVAVGRSEQWFPDSKRVLFRDGDRIWAINVETSNPSILVERAVDTGNFDRGLSVDGKQFAFSAQSQNGVDIWVVPVDDATEKRQVTKSGSVFFLAWSQDSKRFAYAERNGNEYELSIINSDGSGEKKIGKTMSPVIGWSLDGKHLCYMTDGYFKASPDGTNPTEITWPELANCKNYGSTSRDKKYIVHGTPPGAAQLDNSQYQLFVTNLASGETIQITDESRGWRSAEWQP